MNVPPKTKIGLGLGALEIVTTLAGLLVVLGLVIESGPELSTAFVHHIWPSRPVEGGALITAGVFVEVAVGLFLARQAKKQEILAISQITEARERAAIANRRAAELTARLQPRSLTLEQQRQIGEALRSLSGSKVTVYSFGWDQEGFMFSKQIISALRLGGIEVNDRSGAFVSGGLSDTGLSVRAWLTEASAQRIATVLIDIGHVREVCVLAHSSAMISPDGVQRPSTIPLLDIVVRAKPFDVLID